MAVVTIHGENRTLKDEDSIRECLKTFGIDYERWTPGHDVAADSNAEAVLKAYAKEIDDLKTRGGYVTADLINVTPETPGLEEMLAKFNREHWHDEDEVRFIISGCGLFHIRGRDEIPAITGHPGRNGASGATDRSLKVCLPRTIRGRFFFTRGAHGFIS